MNDIPEFVSDRIFDAPRELVWQAWTDPVLLARWYGPGAETVIHEFDLRPGGKWLNEMRWGEKANFQKVIFTEVVKPERLVWDHHSSTDSEWNDAPHPMMPDWPHLLLTTVTFKQAGKKTNVRLSQVPKDASPDEIACFAQAMAGMGKGWGSGFAIIDGILEELQANGGAS